MRRTFTIFACVLSLPILGLACTGVGDVSDLFGTGGAGAGGSSSTGNTTGPDTTTGTGGNTVTGSSSSGGDTTSGSSSSGGDTTSASSSVASSSSSSSGGGSTLNCAGMACAAGEICCLSWFNPANTHCGTQPCGNQSSAITCDGPEDCPQGQVCCGTFSDQINNWASVQCQPACPQPQIVMCHTPADCNGQSCNPSMKLGPGYGFCGN